MDSWHQHTHGNKSAKEYVDKFNEFLIRCNTLNKEGETQILSRFRTDLRDLDTELLVMGINELGVAYTLVQDLDSFKSNSNTRSFKSKSYASKTSSSAYNTLSTSHNTSYKNDTKGKGYEKDNKNKDYSKSQPHNQILQMPRLWTLRC